MHMKISFSRSVEVCANVAIIVVALAIVAVLYRSYRLPSTTVSTTEQKKPSGPMKGTKLEVSGVDWSQSKSTLVLALQKGCHFCTESAPFYQQLMQQVSKQNDLRILAVFPQSPDDARSYLEGLNVHVGEIKQSGLAVIGVNGTPTLILVDQQGIVQQSWIGRLSPDREAEVLRLLKRISNLGQDVRGAPAEITPGESLM
jgi:hypothetical protein